MTLRAETHGINHPGPVGAHQKNSFALAAEGKPQVRLEKNASVARSQQGAIGNGELDIVGAVAEPTAGQVNRLIAAIEQLDEVHLWRIRSGQKLVDHHCVQWVSDDRIRPAGGSAHFRARRPSLDGALAVIRAGQLERVPRAIRSHGPGHLVGIRHLQ